MPPQMAQRLGARAGGETESAFFVAGMSIVAHPRNPKVPTVGVGFHLNQLQ
jgi:coproporphyrinogen III oxidase